MSASDPDDPVRGTVCAPASGSTFAIGTTTVSCTADDTHLNTATATFAVTVNGAVAQLDALIRTLDGFAVAQPLELARTYLLKKDVPDACAQLAEFDREATDEAADGVGADRARRRVPALTGPTVAFRRRGVQTRR